MNPQRIFTCLQSRRITFLQTVLLTSLLALCAVGMASGTAQSISQEEIAEKEEREIEDKIPKHLPIKIKIKNAEKSKDLKNDRWLGDLEIEVKNTGDKPIYFLRLFMTFVDVRRDSGDLIGNDMHYGRMALIDIETLPTPEDVPILPGATHVFKLHEDYVKGWNWYRTRVEKKPHPKKIAIEFSALSFGDGTGFLRTDGMPVPKKESSYGEKKGRETAKIKDNRLLLRPPDVRSQFSSSFLPAAFLQV